MKEYAAYQGVLRVNREGPILKIALHRPELHNAMNPEMIEGLSAVFRDLSSREDVRVVILTGSGRSFCAGADLAYMRAAADFDFDQNLAGGENIFDLMRVVDECPKPVIGRINGAAIGGGGLEGRPARTRDVQLSGPARDDAKDRRVLSSGGTAAGATAVAGWFR